MSEKLHNYLVEKGDYTKSYDDFSAQFASQESQDKLYSYLSESGEYTKSRENFGTQFFAVKLGEQTTQNNVDMLFSAKEGIKVGDEDVVNEAVENYFSLENMPSRPLKPYDGDSDFREFLNDEQTDIKNYFGEEKYAEYLEYNDPDKKTLPKHSKFKEKTNEALRRRQKLALEDASSGMSSDERKIALLSLPDVIEDKDLPRGEFEIYDDKQGKAVQYKNPQELYNSLKETSPEKAMEFQASYLANANSTFNNDIEKFKLKEQEFTKNNADVLSQRETLNKAFNKLGKVTESSSPELIEEYNKLSRQYNALNKTLNERGFDSIVDELVKSQESLNSRREDLLAKAKVFDDSSMALTALGLDYSLSGRTALQLEKSFLAGGAILGAGIMKGIGMGYKEITSHAARSIDEPEVSEKEQKVYDWLNNNYKNAINYYDEVGEEIETTLPQTIKAEDIDGGNVLRAAKQMLGNNSPSILVALASGGVSSGLSMAGKRKAANTAMGVFFQMEAGGKLGDMEVAQKYAQPKIDQIDIMLKDENLTPDERLELKKQRESQENALSSTVFEKAFSSIMYGGIASYAERLGTLSYVNGLNKANKVVKGGLLKKGLYGAKGAVFNVGVELGEETATTLGHNLIDIVALGEDKSLIEGLDTDFLVNTAFTSLAIQGPSMGMNAYNVLKSELTTLQERNASRARAKELNEIQELLKQNKYGGIVSSKQRKELVERKREILKEAAIEEVKTVQKAARLTPKEITDLFESNRLSRKALKQLQELGAQGDAQNAFNKRQRQQLVDDYNKHNANKEQILGNPQKRFLKKMEKAAKENGVEFGTDVTFNAADAAFELGRHQFERDVLKNVIGEDKVKSFQNISDPKLLEYLTQQIEKGVITQQDVAEVFKGADNNAFEFGNDIVFLEDNIEKSILAGGTAAAFAAGSPLHELIHKDVRKVGIEKDGKINDSALDAVNSIEQAMQEKLDNGSITQEAYNTFTKRVNDYKNVNKGKTNLKELIPLVNDLKSAGIISRESQSVLYDLKRVLEGLNNRVFGGNSLFLSFKTADDIFRYVDSFQKQARKQTLIIPPEEEKTGINRSQVYQNVEALYSEEAWNNPTQKKNTALMMSYELVPEAIRRMQNLNLDQDAKESIAYDFAGQIDNNRGLFQTIMKYDRSKNDSVMGYLNAFVPQTKRSLFDVRLQEFYEKHPRYNEIIQSQEQEGVKQKIEKQRAKDEASLDENLAQNKTPKINVLKVGKNKTEQDVIKAVKIKKGDTFKQVKENNTGKVGEIVFNVPANKILNKESNLTYAKKITDGIPESSEAGNIQNYYAFEPALTNEIRVLPRTNVTVEDANVNEVDTQPVSREISGIAIGLSNNVLNYFYDKKFKPNGKRARSKGKKSQVPLWELKDEFINPTPETVKKVQKEFFGITPVGELNDYNRKIGQNLKGFANFTASNKAISAAQRKLDAKKADPQRIADITAAQSRIAFSLNVLGQFNVEVKLDNLLKEKIGMSTYKLNTKAQVDEYIEALKKHVLPLMPRDFWFGQPAFIDTKEIKKELERFGDKFYEMYNLDIKTAKPKLKKALKDNKLLKKTIRELDIKTWGTEFTPGVRSKAKNYEVYQTYYKPEMQKLRNLPDSAFGEKVDGVNDFSRQAYGSIFKDANTIAANIANGKVKAFNDKVGKIHEALWSRINTTIKKDKKSAAAIGNYLKLTASQSNHWHKLGAAFVGYSPKPAGKIKGKNLVAYEYEHAMPATAAYIFLLDAAFNEDVNFDVTYELVMENYKLIALDSAENAKLGAAKLGTTMPKGWDLLLDNWYDRYFNIEVAKQDGGIDPNLILDLDGKSFADKFNVVNTGKLIKENKLEEKKVNQGLVVSSKVNASKGITILDFDDTLATTKSLVKFTAPDGTIGTLNAEQYANTYQDLLEQGYEFDFSDFNKVVKGKLAPLFQKALKLQNKFGPKNMFVLTARPPQAQQAIFDFLTANGLNIPLENITGLANSTSEAKALWVAEKVGEGFNDFYFADDALQNVQAVKNILDQFDVKSKVQQARVNFSLGLGDKLNDIIQENEGVASEKVFSKAEAQLRGAKKGRFKLYIPPGAEDFMGLMYAIASARGKKGEAQIKFFEDNILKPYQEGIRKINSARQQVQTDYKALLKQFPSVKKQLRETVPGMNFTVDAAIRVYLWDKAGFDIPDISKTAKNKLIRFVKNNKDIVNFSEVLSMISKRKEGYVKPEVDWVAGTIVSDLDVATNMVGRKEFLNEFIENVDLIFSAENLSKIEAIYGTDYVEALKDMIFRMKTGKNKNYGQTDKQVTKWTTWISNSVGAIMFLNMRSALLQTISSVNFVNWSDNNPAKAAMALANLPQFAKDFAMIFNSDFLKQRRSGLKTDVNEAAIANAMANKKDKARALIAYLLKKGFAPTQIADSFAIASGGATFYRNRVNTYIKKGLTKKEAETKAFADMQAISEVSQQSADPSLISKQQASILGRFVLAFQNTPMQYARLTKKAAIDLIKGRGDWKSNASKIVYYAAIQNIIFSSLQSALFALAFDDEAEEEDKDKKIERLANTVVDSLLRGTGIYGAVVSTAKNVVLEFWKQDQKDYRADHAYTMLAFANISPPIGSKLRKLYSSTQTRKFNKKVMQEMGVDFNNPLVPALGTAVEAFTNLPLGRTIQKINNASEALNEENEMWQRMALIMGWNTWDLGVEDKEIQAVKEKIKSRKKSKKTKKLKTLKASWE